MIFLFRFFILGKNEKKLLFKAYSEILHFHYADFYKVERGVASNQ